MDSEQFLRLYYTGDSFENTMSLHEMQKVLEGLKEMVQSIYGMEGYEVYIREIQHGSCDIKADLRSGAVQVASNVIGAAIVALLFTQGQPFRYQVIGNNNSIVINNFQGESREFTNGMQIPRILESQKFRTAGIKLTSPVELQGDILTLEGSTLAASVTIDSQQKKSFKVVNNTQAEEIIRGEMYEINLKAQSFRVHIPSQDGRVFVKLGSNSRRSIAEILPYVGTSDLLLSGVAERNMEGDIVKFFLLDFEIAQNQMFPMERVLPTADDLF